MNRYVKEILRIRDEGVKCSGHFDYGANVLPVIEYYANIHDSEEHMTFQNALEEMLTSDDPDIRTYAVTLCLGFFVFRDAVRKK